jgi:D-lactate dehydrogenase
MNLTADNVGYFRYEALKRTKRGVIFVNVARGEMSPSADLLRLLDEDHLGGVALDVFDAESQLAVALRTGRPCDDARVRATLELAKRPNVICTPHNAFNTIESVERKAQQSVQQIEHFLKHRRFLWPVTE